MLRAVLRAERRRAGRSRRARSWRARWAIASDRLERASIRCSAACCRVSPGRGRGLPPDELKRQTFEAVGEAGASREPSAAGGDDHRGPALDRRAVARDARDRGVALVRARGHAAGQPSSRVSAGVAHHAATRSSTCARCPTPRSPTSRARWPAASCRRSSSASILSKAEGSPFFAEEITRSLLEEGYLTRVTTATCRLTRPVEEIRIPGTVQEVIAARLDRLGAEAKRVLQVAAVLGRQFSREQLEQLLAGEGIDVGARAGRAGAPRRHSPQEPLLRTTSTASAKA